MRVIKIDLPQDIKLLEIHTFADEHIGDEHCDMKRLLERIEYVKNTPNAYCIMNGDIIDNATKTSIGDTYTQELNPHTHLPMVMKQAFHRIDPRNNAVALVDKLFVNTAANLRYGGYGEAGEFKPSSMETPVIYLDGTKKDFKARL